MTKTQRDDLIFAPLIIALGVLGHHRGYAGFGLSLCALGGFWFGMTVTLITLQRIYRR